MRYFVRLDGNDLPIGLYRFNLDIPDSISEDRWFEDERTWSDSHPTIADALFEGSMDYDEITVEMALATFPDAFQ